MNFAEANEYLLSLGHETLAIKLGLRNINLLLQTLHNPQQSYPAVQIAGTNGKGSTAVMLDSICRAASISTGLYTSPHLVSITERIKINGTDISEIDFANLAGEVRFAARSLLNSGAIEALPTFFEHVTAIALLAFQRGGVELAILETGLGGRLDATTAVGANVIGITPIAIDHQNYLGETLTEIAREKAAIIHEGSTLVVSPQPPEAREVILERAAEVDVKPLWINSNGRSLPGLGVRGEHQSVNAITAVALAESLSSYGFSIPPEAVLTGLRTAKHPGRLEFFQSAGDASEKIAVLLDGAHNPAGALVLRKYLEELQQSIVLVFGAMADKQLDEMAQILFPLAEHLILTQPRSPRSATVEVLEQLAHKHSQVSAEVFPESENAMVRATSLTAGTEKLICVCGSLYLVGEVRQWLQQAYAGEFS